MGIVEGLIIPLVKCFAVFVVLAVVVIAFWEAYEYFFEKIPKRKAEVEKERAKLNQLYKCAKCQRFSRRHHQELAYFQRILDKRMQPNSSERTCPHHEDANGGIALHEVEEKHDWQKVNPDCFALTTKMYHVYKKGIEKIKGELKEMQDDEALEAYIERIQNPPAPEPAPEVNFKKTQPPQGIFFQGKVYPVKVEDGILYVGENGKWRMVMGEKENEGIFDAYCKQVMKL